MAQKAPYKTKQMEEILTFLKSAQGRHVTVNEICQYFEDQGISVGTTTIYRHLERMVEQGLVAKYTIDNTSSACFEYLDKQEHCQKPVCYHCKCEKCGKLFHMQCEEVSKLQEHMRGAHGFEINPMRTVFYGLCKDCQ